MFSAIINVIKENYLTILIIYITITLIFIIFYKFSEKIKQNWKTFFSIFIFLIPIWILISQRGFILNKEQAWWDITVNEDIIMGLSWDISWENTTLSWFQFIQWSCDYNEYMSYISWSKYKILQVFNKETISPIDFKDFKSYSNVFYVSWVIEEAYLCISSSVVPYRQNKRFYYTTYILFNDTDQAWHIRVWYSTEKKILYDYTSAPNEKELYGRFRWADVPKIYQESLESIIVANREKGWTTTIHPINRLKQQWRIRIWWFVNATNQEGIIKEFFIIYKWWEIKNTPFK